MNKIELSSIPFYFQKFLGSLDVKAMTTREVGAYTRLLLNSIDQPNPGYMNTDEEGLQRIAGLSAQEWAQDRKRVLKKFKHNDLGYHNNAMIGSINEALDKIANEKNQDRMATMDQAADISTSKKNTGIHPLQKWVDDHFTYIKKMKGQLTYKECETLLEKRHYHPDLIKAKLRRLENEVDAHKRWNTVFITIDEWCLSETNKK